MNSKSIDLVPFLGEIENVISTISHERLKSNVIAFAKDLVPAKRLEFLQIIALDDENFDASSSEEYVSDPELLEDAEVYFENIKKGTYNHDLDINSPDEVPAWVDDMDMLFDRADEAFLYNDRKVAAKVYGLLLDALHIAEDIAVEHQLYSAQDIIVTDVSAVKARYFRALYETTVASKRTDVIYEGMKTNFAIGDPRVGLQDLTETSLNEMDGFDQFMVDWTVLVKEKPQNEDDFEKRIRLWLLRESVFMAESFAGLNRLAEEQGASHPEIYYELVACYVKAGDLASAEDAARRGIDKIEVTHQKAVLADWLAELFDRDDNNSQAIKSRREAWRFEPTQERMVNWFNTMGHTLSDNEIQEEINFLREEESPRLVRLICMLELLIGEYDLPRKSLITADPLGWRPESHPGSVVLPFLLIAGAGIADIPDNTSLKVVSEEMKSIFIRWQSHLIDGKKEQSFKTYLDYLFESLERRPISAEQQELFLATAKTVILDRLAVIVSEQLEHLFPTISHFAISFAEVCFANGQKELGMTLITNIRNMYIRQTSLRNEMRTLFNSSALLPHLNQQGVLSESIEI
jgi:hypothetical protein